jgi:hypothetical protein
MCMRRTAVALFFIGSLMTWSPWRSDALAATPQVSDLTDYIAMLGGYLFTTSGSDDTNNIYWVQVSYKVTPATSTSNVTTIVMTRYNPAAVSRASGLWLPIATLAPATPTSTNLAQFNFCASDIYEVDTITLDLRDLQAVSTKTTGTDGAQPTWSIVLQTNSGNFIRENKQSLPPTCPYSGWDKKGKVTVVQTDVTNYPILFANEQEANQFQKLVSNVIPTLNPPVLIGVTPGQ